MTGDRELRQGREAATVAAPSGCQAPVIDLTHSDLCAGRERIVLFGTREEVAPDDVLRGRGSSACHPDD